MALTAAQKALRENIVGASFVPMLMAAKEDAILNEWRRLVGDPDYVDEDLTDNWPVQFGNYMEPFMLDWHERRTGQVLTLKGMRCPHPELEYLAATLDAFRASDKTVIDAKTAHAYRILDDVRAYYVGQLVVQKSCVSALRAALLIVHGGTEPQEFEVIWDAAYEQQVWERIKWFWSRVETMQPPCQIPAIKGPVPAVRIVDFTRNNTWGNAAGIYIANKKAAGDFNDSVKTIKGLLEADVAKAHGHGIIASRNRAGAISIKEGFVNG